MDALRILKSEIFAEDQLIPEYDPCLVLFVTGVAIWATFEEIDSLDRRMPFIVNSVFSESLPRLKFLMEYCYGRPQALKPKRRSVFSRRRK